MAQKAGIVVSKAVFTSSALSLFQASANYPKKKASATALLRWIIKPEAATVRGENSLRKMTPFKVGRA
jgi:hypothetical protein